LECRSFQIVFLDAYSPGIFTVNQSGSGSAVVLHQDGVTPISDEIGRRGALDVLRNGFKDSGCKFQLAYFRPASGLNEETQRLHAANLFSVVRQLHYSEKNENSLDLVVFLNGIPSRKHQTLDSAK
jgi:hypothetical protein